MSHGFMAKSHIVDAYIDDFCDCEFHVTGGQFQIVYGPNGPSWFFSWWIEINGLIEVPLISIPFCVISNISIKNPRIVHLAQ